MKTVIGRLGLGATLVLALAGCAQEREPINRVQANALKKSFFVGEDLTSTADDPEFYKRDTVVDVGYGAAQDGLFTSTYAQPVSRIRWEITENALNARLSYERIKGSDNKGNQFEGNVPKAANDGQIVASYRITSHFDIRRSYNPATGEELNVVEENGFDRPWYEREFFRVDWSTNMVTDAYDFDTLSMMGIYGGINYEPMAYTVNDPSHPDAPHFEDGYFDVTNKAFATPQVVDLSSLGWGIDKFPACYLPGEFAGGTNPYGNCNPTEITLRSSYRQVVDKDYEPAVDDGYRFFSAGSFVTEYRGYERNYGMLDNQWFRFLSRYNIWERSHFYTDPVAMTGAVACATAETTKSLTADPNRDENGDGTADECEAVTKATGSPGSRCDIFTKKCTLPYAKRATAVIPWYVAGDTSDDLFEATEWATEEWDIALKLAAQASRLTECRKAGGTNCEQAFPVWFGQQDDNDEAMEISRDFNACQRQNAWAAKSAGVADVCRQLAQSRARDLATQRGNPDDPSTLAIGTVVALPTIIPLCHNPVAADDHPACGEAGKVIRTGDLRYNVVNHIAKPQQPSAWGIMVDADDPLTGEKVAASINIWTHVTDIASQGLLDSIRYANGELTNAQVTDGKYVLNWAQASRLGNKGAGTMTKEEVESRLAAAANLDLATYQQKIVGKKLPAELAKPLAQAKAVIRDTAVDVMAPSANAAQVSATLKRARGTEVESELINQPMMQLAGVKGNLPIQGVVADMVSPLGLNREQIRAQFRRMKENALAERGACIINEAPEASSIVAMADAMATKFPIVEGETDQQAHERHQRMHRYIRRKMHYAVIGHEMGHSVGLRHNFVSTTGPLHYRPQYWQLRTRNGEVTDVCKDAQEDGTNCVGPRYFDPMTKEEQDGLIEMFMQSTVMDYPGDLSQDMIGLGAYDFHAARMFYGDTASVYQSGDYAAGTKVGVGIAAMTDTFGGLAGIKYSVKNSNPQEGATRDIHYSELQNEYKVIGDCYEVKAEPAKGYNGKAGYDPAKDGIWHPVLDGRYATIDGVTKKCRQQPVDYVPYSSLRFPTEDEAGSPFFRGGPNVDELGRSRVGYHFATDRWADTGNVSVFRHDNGADPYEQLMFLITTSETKHIFDNYRRGRQTFDVRSASSRYYGRYNEKILGIASGMAFINNIYADLGTNTGYTSDTLVPFIQGLSFKDNILAGTIAFDHFAKVLSRPQAGPHYRRAGKWKDNVLRSSEDTDDYGPNTGGNTKELVTIPNGATGYMRDLSFGGRPMNNAFAENQGEYDTDYTINAGAYYPKTTIFELLSQSEDRFISSSRRDFYDARFRANGIPDMFPEGYRRLLANALTGDRSLLAPHLKGTVSKPDVGADLDPSSGITNFPSAPLAWTSWWPKAGPKICRPADGRMFCYGPEGTDLKFTSESTENDLVAVDPQVGWEVQKFMIMHALSNLRDTATMNWIDMMTIYKAGPENTPDLAGRIEWEDPSSGQVYYAKRYGKECLFGDPTNNCEGGKIVERGIAARVLEYANQLTAGGYKLDKTAFPATKEWPAGFNEFGRAMVLRHPGGLAIVAADPALSDIEGEAGTLKPVAECDQNKTPTCTPLTIEKNHFAMELKRYKSVPEFMRQAAMQFGLFGKQGTIGYYPLDER